MKLAIIGLGGCAVLYRNALKLRKKIAVTAVCDNNRDADAALFPDSAFFCAVETLAAHKNLFDAAVVATPPSTHYALIQYLLQNGIDTITEKPATTTEDDFISLAEIAAQNRRVLNTAYHASFSAEVIHFLAQRKEYERGLGKLCSFSADFFDPYCKSGAVNADRLSLGGSYVDSAVNALSVLYRIFQLDAFRVAEHNQEKQNEAVIRSTTTYCGGDITGTVKTDWTTGENRKETLLFYENGSVKLNHSAQRIEVSGKNGMISCDCGGGTERLVNQYCNMLDDTESALNRKESNIAMTRTIQRLLYDKATAPNDAE